VFAALEIPFNKKIQEVRYEEIYGAENSTLLFRELNSVPGKTLNRLLEIFFPPKAVFMQKYAWIQLFIFQIFRFFYYPILTR